MYGPNLRTIPPGVDGTRAVEEVRRRVFGADGPAPGSAEADVGYLRSEHMLVRFLVARQWDVDKACLMLREHYKWLAETKMAVLLKDPWPDEGHIKKYYPQAYHGTDKLGRPIYIERPGNIDMPRLLQAVSPERLLQYMAVGSELQIRRRLPACSLVRGEVVDKSLNIMDLDGLGFRVVTHTTARRVLKDVVAVLQNHYPEVAGRTIIINAPKVFSIAWSFVKPMLDEKTVAKISIFGTERAAWSEALLELVDADQLPALFGGRCRCDGKDEISCMRSVKGPWAEAEAKAVLDAEPIERIMTPDGAREAHQKWLRLRHGGADEEPSEQEAGEGAPAEPAVLEPPAGEAEPAVLTALVGEAEEPVEEEEEGELAELPVGTRQNPHAAEVRNLELEASLLQEEYRQHEDAHMATITAWVSEYNELMSEIGRSVIERSQGYYDSMTLWQQAVQEYARQQSELDRVTAQLEVEVKNLSRVEAALVGDRPLSEEEWARIAPLPDEEGCEASPGLTELRALRGDDADGRLVRTLRMSAVADKVAALQLRRDASRLELVAKERDLDDCKGRFDQEEQSHSACTWNCSVKRSAPYHEKRRMHETKVETQLAVLRSLERRLQQTRQQLATLTGLGTAPVLLARTRSRQMDEMSLQSFEIPAGAPAEDEWLSCASDISEDQNI